MFAGPGASYLAVDSRAAERRGAIGAARICTVGCRAGSIVRFAIVIRGDPGGSPALPARARDLHGAVRAARAGPGRGRGLERRLSAAVRAVVLRFAALPAAVAGANRAGGA